MHCKAEVLVCDTYERYKEKFEPILRDIVGHQIKAVFLYSEDSTQKWSTVQGKSKTSKKKAKKREGGLQILSWR